MKNKHSSLRFKSKRRITPSLTDDSCARIVMLHPYCIQVIALIGFPCTLGLDKERKKIVVVQLRIPITPKSRSTMQILEEVLKRS